jgi:hypothetical protein
MIAHVAEASEDRGRVIVQLGNFACSSASAIAAAVHVAVAFRSQLEGLFVENPDLYAAAGRDGGRELACHGQKLSLFSAKRLSEDADHFAVAAQRQLATAAAGSAIAFSARVSRDAAVGALQSACAQSGPWNIIVLAEPVATFEKSAQLSKIMAEVFGTTGTIVTGTNAAWRKGPVIAAVEDIERLNGMIRAAQRLAAVAGDEVLLLPVGTDEIDLDWLESEIRLTLGNASGVRVLPRPSHVDYPGVLQVALREHRPRLVIARHGGTLMPVGGAAKSLNELGCPVFLVH